MDYAKYGLDPQAIGAASADALIVVESDALSAELELANETDPEDKTILAERAATARAKADEARQQQKVTKREVAAMRRNLLANACRAIAQQHLSLIGQRELATEFERANIDGTLADLEQRLAVTESLLNESKL
jgi:hypothetical protein